MMDGLIGAGSQLDTNKKAMNIQVLHVKSISLLQLRVFDGFLCINL